MIMQKLLISSLLFTTALTFANDQQTINERLNDNRVQSEPNRITEPKIPASSQAQKPANNQSISITKEELAQRPDLVIRALEPALVQGNSETLALIFPIYQQLDEKYHHPIATKWAEAILAKHQLDYAKSIRLYREILAENAGNDVVRLQLATTLFANNELESAEDQFQKLRAEALPGNIRVLIDDYLSAIHRKDRWTFSGGLTYLNDPNINNAPKSGTTFGNWSAPKKESAEGIGFNLALGKKWSWGNGFYNELRLNGNGKYYWDNLKYNEVTGRASLGLGFQNAKIDLEILPFMEQTLYAGGNAQSETLKRFSKSSGVTLELQHWLNAKWQLNSTYEYAEQRYTKRKHLNGNYHYLSVGGLYLVNAKQYWFANLNYTRTATRDKDDSYFRRGLNLGWQQEWNWGLSTRFSASIYQKRYKAPMPIFGITQRNKEYGLQASIWHRAVHYWGITPRLTYQFSKTRSNHSFYSYDKHRVFVDFSRTF